MKKSPPNTTTAPTGQIAPFGLRMLPELRARIEEAARVSGRSMNAEVVARLEASFEIREIPTSREAELLVAAFHTQYDMLALRMELIRTKMDSLQIRSRFIQADSERLTKEAKTDEDFDRARKSTEQLRDVEAQAGTLAKELEQLVQDRAALNKQNADTRAMLAEGRSDIEARLNSSLKIR